ncbi:MAG: chemotaxis protein CheR, partial [Deltaproteobacteria bacterium]|nr:chemotaxis protein CheR [Deltaproteobacteria bacterium]
KDINRNQLSKLIDAISTNLTSFFRENQHFDYLQKELLPHLLQKKQKNGNLRIRAWSAGCSSGEEPYSIAITLLDNIPNPSAWDIKILASDISESMIGIADTGIYPKEKVAPVSQSQKYRFFISRRIKGKKTYEVSTALRDITMFRYLNLVKEWPIKCPVDFIFCRNVMIYFDKSTQQELINRFWDILDSGGIFFTGHSESLTGITHKFKYLYPTIYMKP